MRLLINVFIFLLLLSAPSWATIYYVRDGGGTPAQCNGQTNATLSGATGKACALSNVMFVLGAGCNNFGFGPCNVPNIMASGDTLDINGDSDISPGNQAQYPVGYDATGIITPINSSNCNAGGSLNCTTGNPPSGTAGNLTTIQTTPGSTHRAQLWGREKINQVLEADASFLLLNNLEITDHSNCLYGGPAVTCSNTSPFGSYGIDGVFYGGTGSEMENMWIHGMSHNGTQSDNITNWLSENNIINGNGFNGDAPGDLYGSSSTPAVYDNVTWDHDIIVFNGCSEVYPPHSSNPYDLANYQDCFDQANAGQGDGLGLQSALSDCGTMTFTNDDISFNTQDGIDMHHCPANGTSYIIRVRAEGNEGQQVKMANANSYMENDVFVGDCYWHNANNPIDFHNSNGMNNCRAGSSTVTIAPYGGNYHIDNTTILTTGAEMIDNSPDPNAPCSSPSGTVELHNDNFIAGWNTPVLGNTEQASLIYQDCSFGGSFPSVTEDYNHIWNTSGGGSIACGSSPGTHDICNDSSSATIANLTTSVIGPTAYYQGIDLGHQLYPAVGGTLIGSANNAITLQGTSNDFNNFARGSSWTIGGYQINSTVANTQTCFNSSECASGGCVANVCSGSCTATGAACSVSNTCCTGLCSNSQCVTSICGNNIIEGSEACDGTNLNNQTCLLLGFAGGGNLSCNSGCGSFNTSGCSSTVSFPTTSILDTFTRANSTGLGANWTQASGQMNIVSNAAVPITGGSASDKYYWNPTVFGANEEIYTTISNKGTNGDSLKLYARLNVATGNGYKLEPDLVNGVINLFSQTTSNNLIFTKSQAFSTGDSLGMSLNGNIISIFYKPNGGSWGLEGSLTDSSISAGGNLELGSDTGAGATPNIAFTNFGGGNIGGCAAFGAACSVTGDCCTGLCSNSQCVSCVANGNACSANSDCCGGDCSSGTCIVPPSTAVSYNNYISGKSLISGNSNL